MHWIKNIFICEKLVKYNKIFTSTDIWRETKQSIKYKTQKGRNIMINKKTQKLKISAHTRGKDHGLEAGLCPNTFIFMFIQVIPKVIMI